MSDENVYDYIEFSDKIEKMIANNKIPVQQTSDFISLKLLCEYGGIWLDATMFLTKKLDKEIYKYSFYSNKLKCDKFDNTYISLKNRGGFAIACSKGNRIPFLVSKIMLDYFENYYEGELLSYFFYRLCY